MMDIRTLLLSAIAFGVLFAPISSFAENKKEEKPLSKKHQRRQNEIDKFDANLDGVLQIDELKESLRKTFAQRDFNADGFISEDEREMTVQKFEAEGLEEYGKIAEKKARKLNRKLKIMDKNDDDKLSFSEYETYMMGRYEKMDKDEDGAWSVKEFKLLTESSRDRANSPPP